jgi:O-antigen/teichoic acid export membrane protein
MDSVRKPLAYSFIDKYCVTLIQFGSTVVLARLLTPEEIGIYSLGAVIIGFAQMVRDFGVSQYLVQERELSTKRIRTAFSASLIVGWSLAILLLLFKNILADFYAEEGVKDVIAILCITLFFLPFNAVVLALLRRNMRFGSLLIINVIAALTYAITGIGLALLDFGFESLAWAGVTSSVMTLAIGITRKPENLTFLPSFEDFRRIFSFGISSSSASLLNALGQGAPDLTISKNLSFEALGFYSRAVGLTSVFNYVITAAVQPVVLPSFSQTVRNGTPLKSAYLRAINYYTLLAWPFYAFVGIMALPLLRVLYGDQWDRAVPIVQILCVAYSLYALVMFSGSALVSLGMVNVNLRIAAICQPARLVFTLIASFYSLEMVALVQVIFYLTIIMLTHHLLHKEIKVEASDIFRVIYKNIGITFGSVIGCHLFLSYACASEFIYHLFAGGVGWLLFLILSIYITRHPIRKELQSMGHFVISRAKSSRNDK